MDCIKFDIATIEDIEDLTLVSINSFHSDINFGADKFKGPPGYDSVEFHKQMIQEASYFYKIINDDKIIGAFWFMKQQEDEAYLYRIFLDPAYHKKGIGLKAFDYLFNNFPEIKSWSLRTPKWNNRTPNFYHKAGFKISEETERFFIFIRQIQES
jgi:ribosomal protein S18 acetylase RimI-like enzyme